MESEREEKLPMKYDVEIVRQELIAICDEFPERRGTAIDGPICCYATYEGSRARRNHKIRDLRPCCLVGEWIWRHPELLENDEIQRLVLTNSIVRDWPDLLLPASVVNLLAYAQDIQDNREGDVPHIWREVKPFLETWTHGDS